MLVGHEPGGLAFAYLVCGGSEAVEAALKMARQYFVEIGQPQRTRFIARRQSYHGNTLGALAAGGNAWRRAPYAPLLSDAFSHVTPAFAYREMRADESEADFVARLAAELEAEFQRLGPQNVAAFVAEPVVGATSGCVNRAGRLFPGRPRGLRPAWRAAHPGRGDVGNGPHRDAPCLGAGGHLARPPDHRQGPGRRLPAHRRRARLGPHRGGAARRLRRFPAWPHLSRPSFSLRRRARGAEGDPRGGPSGPCRRDGSAAWRNACRNASAITAMWATSAAAASSAPSSWSRTARPRRPSTRS